MMMEMKWCLASMYLENYGDLSNLSEAKPCTTRWEVRRGPDSVPQDWFRRAGNSTKLSMFTENLPDRNISSTIVFNGTGAQLIFTPSMKVAGGLSYEIDFWVWSPNTSAKVWSAWYTLRNLTDFNSSELLDHKIFSITRARTWERKNWTRRFNAKHAYMRIELGFKETVLSNSFIAGVSVKKVPCNKARVNPPVEQPVSLDWKIVEGSCSVKQIGGSPCAMSSNYPQPYKNDESCVVKMTNTRAVKVVDFVTEKYFDILTVGDQTIDGAPIGKKTINLAAGVNKIRWSSDFYLGASGWKICKTSKKAPGLPGAEKPKCDETMSGTNDKGYRGCQTRTKSGRICQQWKKSPAKNNPHKEADGLTKNYCRFARGDFGKTIWCYTTDPSMYKEECYSGE